MINNTSITTTNNNNHTTTTTTTTTTIKLILNIMITAANLVNSSARGPGRRPPRGAAACGG